MNILKRCTENRRYVFIVDRRNDKNIKKQFERQIPKLVSISNPVLATEDDEDDDDDDVI